MIFTECPIHRGLATLGHAEKGVKNEFRNGTLHGVDVDAESLYEAVAIAVASFREDDVSPSEPGPMTEFTVAVYRNPTEHKLRLQHVLKWSEHQGRPRRNYQAPARQDVARLGIAPRA